MRRGDHGESRRRARPTRPRPSSWPSSKAFEGQEVDALVAPDPVNQAMIRHWVEAMGDKNPVYTDPEAAAASVHGEIDRARGDAPGLADAGPPRQPPRAGQHQPAGRCCSTCSSRRASSASSPRTASRSTCGCCTSATASRPARSSTTCPTRSTPVSASATSSPPASSTPPTDGELVGTQLLRLLKFRPGTGKGAGRRVRRGGRRRGRAAAAATAARHHPRQPLLLRGREGAPAAHPAVRGLPGPAPPAPAPLRQVRLVRLGRAASRAAAASSTATW